MAEIINLRQARKARERARKAEEAAQNRAASGRKKAEREGEAAKKALDERRLEGHRLDPDEP